jgi:two-component system alkaline phosphatase synthesis response regulator PhoP
MPDKILLIEDESAISDSVSYSLENEGFEVLTAADGVAGLAAARSSSPDLIILDLMLPILAGLEVCRRIRLEGHPVAVIMLTAKDQEIDRVLGFELGADDYIIKPFSPRELVARVRAVLRRTSARNDSPHEKYPLPGEKISIDGLIIDSNKYEVKVNGKPVEVTPKEFELLYFLARNAGRVMTRDNLLNNIWDYAFDGDTRIVDVHVSHLREKIEANPKNPVYIKTVRGVGYKFKGD